MSGKTICPHGIAIFTDIPTPQGLATVSLLDARSFTADTKWWDFFRADGSPLGSIQSKIIAGYVILPEKLSVPNPTG
jgi:hypothetical protein